MSATSENDGYGYMVNLSIPKGSKPMSAHTSHTPWVDGPSNPVRGVTPYHEYHCGCKASILGMDRCPLHAAAPALLEALESVVDHLDRDWHQLYIEQARAAIKLARGGESDG